MHTSGDGPVEGHGEKLRFRYLDREHRKKHTLCAAHSAHSLTMESYVELIKYRISDDVRNWVNLTIREK